MPMLKGTTGVHCQQLMLIQLCTQLPELLRLKAEQVCQLIVA